MIGSTFISIMFYEGLKWISNDFKLLKEGISLVEGQWIELNWVFHELSS